MRASLIRPGTRPGTRPGIRPGFQLAGGVLLLLILLASSCTTVPGSESGGTSTLLLTVPASHATNSVIMGFSGAPARPGGRVVDSDRMITGLLQRYRLRRIEQFPISHLNVEAVVVEISDQRDLKALMRALSLDARVESVQQVQPYRALAYNDPYFSLQDVVSGESIETIHELATGKDVVVGIVDTGVDRWHPELADRIIYSKDFVSDDEADFDVDEHGTAVAGVIGSAANNDLGIVGIAPEVSLMVFKACREDHPARQTSCDSVSIIRALNDVLSQQPDILNLSLAGPKDPMIARLLRAAVSRGIVLVAAVDEGQPWQQSFPASMPEVIAVATAGGGNTSRGLVLAPGANMLTTSPGATYGFKSGSSMATAYVSGVAALMKETTPGLTAAQIQAMLLRTSRLDENQVPVVDLCLAVNSAANLDYPMCPVSRNVALKQ